MIGHVLDTSIGEALTLDQFLLGLPGDPDITHERAAHRCSTAMAPHVVADRLPADFEVRPECLRVAGNAAWVWEDELVIVALEGGHTLSVEFWGSESGYHDRLDELAGLVVA